MLRPFLHNSCFWLGLFIVLTPITITAQTPCYFIPRVTDSQSGEPLIGASLKMDGYESSMSTDSLGMLRMPVTCAEHSVRFQLLGYKPFSRKITVSGQAVVEITMENIATQIEEVVISSQGSTRTMETPALGVSMLNMKAVQKLPPAAGEVDILRGIQTLPGISAVGEGANGVNIRGGAVDQNLVLLDNMPVFNP
ncbi:MAG: carboxypeptidase-like regulatory domain-containing protein, partial [Saprospiraceae bacterium]|nr:carboxypeptidase-like regulatory domain-containing protein [Saprospiraceae bacterium]